MLHVLKLHIWQIAGWSTWGQPQHENKYACITFFKGRMVEIPAMNRTWVLCQMCSFDRRMSFLSRLLVNQYLDHHSWTLLNQPHQSRLMFLDLSVSNIAQIILF